MTPYDYSELPEHMRDAMQRYLEQGIPPGDFLSAVLNNDLRETCSRADHINRYLLFDYVRWLYNNAPVAAWGYQGAVRDWCVRLNAQQSLSSEKTGE